MKTKYRQAKEKDFKQIAKIIYQGQKSWPKEGREKLKEIELRITKTKESKTTLVAEKNGKIIGTSSYFKEINSFKPREEANDLDAHLGGFYLSSDYWGTKEAESLLNYTKEQMKTDGFNHVRLWAPVAAKRARGFYEKSGWVQGNKVIEHEGIKRIEYTLDLY